MDDLRVNGGISLSINRAAISSKKCIHPQCPQNIQLRRFSIETRHNLMKTIRFYVAPRALGCDLHRNMNVWSATDINGLNFPFTKDQIEDMVDLLRFQPKKLNFDLSGWKIGENILKLLYPMY